MHIGVLVAVRVEFIQIPLGNVASRSRSPVAAFRISRCIWEGSDLATVAAIAVVSNATLTIAACGSG